jgi:hypothetical protein
MKTLRRVALVRTDVSEERITSIIRMTKIGELGRTLAFLRSVIRLLVIASVPSQPILVILTTDREVDLKRPFVQEPHGVNILEDSILQSPS